MGPAVLDEQFLAVQYCTRDDAGTKVCCHTEDNIWCVLDWLPLAWCLSCGWGQLGLVASSAADFEPFLLLLAIPGYLNSHV